MQKKFSHPQTGVTTTSLRGNIYPLRFARPPKIEGQFLFIYNSSPVFRGGAHRAEGLVLLNMSLRGA